MGLFMDICVKKESPMRQFSLSMGDKNNQPLHAEFFIRTQT